MCGFAGMIQKGLTKDTAISMLEKMSSTMIHRGPDDSGVWTDVKAGVGLCFRRLSIIDLALEGHQPMVSNDGRYVIAYNGEIYNFDEIRSDLEKEGHTIKWRGHSDTEIILEAISILGLENAITKFIGMFAFALWDNQERTLHLVRDRLGIKPLYYGVSGNTFLFGSELSALKAHPNFQGEIDRDVLSLYLKRNAVPSPYSIYRGIAKLPPGSIVSIKDFGTAPTGELSPRQYWSPKDAAERGYKNPFSGNVDDAIYALD